MRRATRQNHRAIQGTLFFNPRPPCGGRHNVDLTPWADYVFQSTPSMRRATELQMILAADFPFSIHALHAEGDQPHVLPAYEHNFSIHALHAEGDHSHVHIDNYTQFFNPRPPCGGRPCGGRRRRSYESFSIHALHAEGDWSKAAATA